MRGRLVLAGVLLLAADGTAALADPPGLFGVFPPAPTTPAAVPAPPDPPVHPPRRRLPAAAGVVVRAGNHPGFGRLIFDLPAGALLGAQQDGETITLQFATAAPASLAGVMVPRNVRSLSTGAHEVTITLVPGSLVRQERAGGQLVLDVLDPPPGGGADRPDLVVSAHPIVAEPAAGQPADMQPAGPGAPREKVEAVDLPPMAVSGARLQGRDNQSAESDVGASEPPPAQRGTAGAAETRPPAAARKAPPAALQAASPVPPAGVAARTAAPAAAAPQPAGSPGPAGPTVVVLPPASPQLAHDSPAHDAPPQDAPGPAPVLPPSWAELPSGNGEPLRLSAARIPLPAGSRGSAINLPFARTTAAAGLRRGDWAVLVFDENRPIDVSGLRGDPVFEGAAVQVLEGATVLRVRMPAQSSVRLAPVANGWTVWIGPQGDPLDTTLQPMPNNVTAEQMQFAASGAAKVVVVPDADTGVNLLVGTQREPGQGVVAARRTPDFILLPSFQGVAIEPASDRPQLRVLPTGFLLTGGDHPLALSDIGTTGTAAAEAAALTRRYDLQPLPPAMLRQRLQNRIDQSAATPPLARLAPRRAVAEAMLSLGMGVEAQAMLRLAVTDDPRGSDDLDTLGLGAMAALVAGRTDASGAIEDPRLSGTDEIRLWRAIRRALIADAQIQQGGVLGQPTRDAAADLAATAPLVLAYPDKLRDAVLPLVAETEVLGGQLAAAATLLDKRKDDPSLNLARAFLLRAKGDNAASLAVLDRLARGRDRLVRFRASIAAIELRLATKAWTAAQAAEAGEKLLYAWRGDARERTLRIQIASWHFQAGQWRPALAMLRESATLFPDQRTLFNRAITATLRDLMRDDRVAKMDSIELISLLEENMELLPDGPEGQAASVLLADRMESLDLDQRAAPVLEHLAKATPSLPARAAFGARLASMRLAAGDAQGALDALSVSASDGLPAELTERRGIIGARADAASGRLPQATSALSAIGTPAADAACAEILEAAKDWAGAATALTAYVGRTVPAEGALSAEQSHAVLRLAADFAQAGDEGALASLREQFAVRMASGPDAAAFRLLTQAPLRDVSDLPRSAKEMAAARAVTAPVR